MKIIYLLPNLITLCNLFCGFYSIYFAIQGLAFHAIYLIFGAMFFDFLDGEIALLMKAESEFGTHLDSLADLVSFGIAPIVLVYILFPQEYKKIGWFFSFLYIGCGVLRLSRYNVQGKNAEKKYFSGLPIPAAAGLIVSLVMIYLNFKKTSLLIFILLSMICAAFLMISYIRYPYLGKIYSKIKKLPILFVLLLFLTIALFHYLHFTLLFCFTGYALIGILFEIRRRLCLGRKENSYL